MLKVPINTDVKEYTPKYLNRLTARQLVSLLVGFAYSYTIVGHLHPKDLTDASLYVTLLMLPALAFGFFKPYGQPLERFLMRILRRYIMYPKRRKYELVGRPELTQAEEKAEKERKMSWKEKRQRKKELKKYGGFS